MAILSIDHVILATSDLAAAAVPWSRLGLSLTPPMRHHGAATENSVFFVGDATTEFYVELLGVHNVQAAQAEGHQNLLAGIGRGGLHQLMLQVDDTGAAVESFANAGIGCTVRDVFRDDQSRIGTVVEPDTDRAGCRIGLIQYEGGAPARIERHGAAGLFEHDFPLERLDHLAVITGDLDAMTTWWADVVGVATVGEVRGRGMIIRQLQIGDAVLESVGPDGPDSPVATRPPGLASVTAFEVGDVAAVVALARDRGFTVAEPAAGVLPDSIVATIGADQLGGLALQLIEFSR